FRQPAISPKPVEDAGQTVGETVKHGFRSRRSLLKAIYDTRTPAKSQAPCGRKTSLFGYFGGTAGTRTWTFAKVGWASCHARRKTASEGTRCRSIRSTSIHARPRPSSRIIKSRLAAP